MKEIYFTPHSLADKAVELCRPFASLRRRRLPSFSPGRSALLLLDMQDYFLEANSHAYVPSAQAIIPGIQALCQAYAAQELPIFFTRHTNDLANAACMATWWRDLLTPVHPLNGITPQLDISLGRVLEKSQYDAFYGTSLEEMLHGRQATQVVICGVMTHLCCETTARSAFVRGFEVFFTVDGTATYHEGFHRATLLNLAHGFATPVLVNEILAVLKEQA